MMNEIKLKYFKLISSFILFCIVAIILLFLSGILSFSKKIESGSVNLKYKIPDFNRQIKLEEIEVPVIYSTVGTVQSREEVKISSRIIAKITNIYVREGDKIKKGDLLVSLDDSDLKANLAKAMEKLKEAEASYSLAEKELERTKTLYKKNAASKKIFDEVESRYKSAEASFLAAKEAVKEAEAVLSFASIRSPMDAIVARRFLEIGDLAAPGVVILQIFDNSRLMLHVPINESLISKIKIGDKLKFSVDAVNKMYEGEIKEISNEIDPLTRSFMVKICLGEAPELLPGMFGRLHITTGTEKVLLIPDEAIFRSGQLEFVYKLEKDVPQKTLIRTTEYPFEDGNRRVVSGLKINDIIFCKK